MQRISCWARSRLLFKHVFVAMLSLAAGLLAIKLATVTAIAADVRADRAAVTRALDESAAAWSRNDLAAFMSAYEDAPSTTYLKGERVLHGYGAIRAMYASRFGGSGSMSRLSTDVLEFRPLGRDFALCIGRFALTAASGSGIVAHGMFTLVFHRTRNGWKIVSDHTSS